MSPESKKPWARPLDRLSKNHKATFSRKTTALSTPVGHSGRSKNQEDIFKEETALSTSVGRSRLPENPGPAFSGKNQPWARPLDVQGFQKIQGPLFPEKQPWARPLHAQGFLKSESLFPRRNTLEHASPLVYFSCVSDRATSTVLPHGARSTTGLSVYVA